MYGLKPVPFKATVELRFLEQCLTLRSWRHRWLEASLRVSCIFPRPLIPPILTRWPPHAVERRMGPFILPMSSGPDADAAITRGTRMQALDSMRAYCCVCRFPPPDCRCFRWPPDLPPPRPFAPSPDSP